MNLPPFIHTPSVRAGLVLVTPEMATELLGKQGKNRRLSQRLVKRYAEGFDGHTTIYQPIVLDAAGRVLDGQHRLHAIVQYGRAVKVWFIIGAPASSWQDFDQGKTRSLGDVLSGNGVLNACNVAAVLTLVHRYETGKYEGTYIPNRDVLVHDYETNAKAYDAATTFAVNRRDISVAASPAQVAFVCFNLGDDAARLDDFWNMVATGVGAKNGSPALQYRNAILMRSAGGRKTASLAKLSMLIKAVNAELAGRDIKALRYAADEAVPALVYSRGKMK